MASSLAYRQILSAAGLALTTVAGAQTEPRTEPMAAGKVFGMPAAVVTEETFAGAPVIGDTASLVPELVPLAAGRRTHQVRLDILAREIEVAPDVRFQAWTFGGSVPGPIVHVREGDRVRFAMSNRSHEVVVVTAPERSSPHLTRLAAMDPQKASSIAMPMRHSMDFHAGTVAANDKWRGIEPGQTIRFEWVANYPGVYLYHCGTPPILQHMSMGQYGVVIVSPRHGYPTDARSTAST